ncbi:hypothetical protein [Candidatus Nitrospira salsa]|nr:MAG: hypothetical protein NPIRA01_27610 [Nitrospirales bacterium]
MAAWKDLLLDTLKLTEEVKRLTRDIERLNGHVIDVDKRLVRLETMVEMAKGQKLLKNI